MSDPIISFQDVSKVYRLGLGRSSLREALAGLYRRVASPDRRAHDRPQTLWALHNVSFQVHPGELVGIIGSNGAGKTTILKLLSQITKPSSGQVVVNGRLSALIELGAGFHPDLTGRENIYLNGAILGLGRKELDGKFDRIVEFSGLKRFLDTPVKRYSSGMYARLGFAIAIHVDPDILLVDEVLAVGDQAFQTRCLQRMRELRRSAHAVVFVSHNLVAVRELCDRVIWLAEGHIQASGDPEQVIDAYRASALWQRSVGATEHIPADTAKEPLVRITAAQILDDSGVERDTFRIGEPLVVRIEYHARQPIQDPTFALAVWRHDGFKCGETSNLQAGIALGDLDGTGCIQVRFDDLRLMPDRYYINVAISDRYMVQYDHVTQAAQFVITSAAAGTLGQTGPFRFPGVWRRGDEDETDRADTNR